MIRARIRVDGRLAGGLQALLGAPMAAYSGCGERDGGIGHGKRRSRTVSLNPGNAVSALSRGLPHHQSRFHQVRRSYPKRIQQLSVALASLGLADYRIYPTTP